jgi:hypothetical protein
MENDNIQLAVRPLGDGWAVDSNLGVEPIVFGSGARAEAHAHAFAQRMAGAGADARVLVHDRAERLVGATRYFADE